MSQLLDAIKNSSNTTTTTNGMAAFKSAGEVFTDLFFKIGAARGKFDTHIKKDLMKAADMDLDLTGRLLLWVRDVRGGAGERDIFREALLALINTSSITDKQLEMFIAKIPTLGRWDDVLVCFDTRAEKYALALIKAGLHAEDGLCAKWMPRERSSKPKHAYKIRKYLSLSPPQYRKLLVRLTNVVEQQMCAKEWKRINYSHVPSKAANQYRKAFYRNDEKRFEDWVAELSKPANERSPDVKVNAGAIFPHDIMMKIVDADGWSFQPSSNKTIVEAAVAQWDALPNYLEGSNERILPLVDVSGSMSWNPVTPNSNIKPIHVAIGLGLYFAERNESIFKDHFMTFHSSPNLVSLSGSLPNRVKQMVGSDWGGSTNIELAFSKILNAAVQNNVPVDQMPTQIMIFSDMQFNSCIREPSSNAYNMIKKNYAKAGYEVPTIVFWNLNAQKNTPVEYNTRGTALVSGFSPAIVQSLVSGKDLSPLTMMIDTLSKKKYTWIA